MSCYRYIAEGTPRTDGRTTRCEDKMRQKHHETLREQNSFRAYQTDNPRWILSFNLTRERTEHSGPVHTTVKILEARDSDREESSTAHKQPCAKVHRRRNKSQKNEEETLSIVIYLQLTR